MVKNIKIVAEKAVQKEECLHNKSIVKFLVLRYLRFDKSQPFITISALLAFFGVSLGLMVLIVAMAIMNGTAKEFEKKLFTMNYPLSVLPKFSNSVNEDLLVLLENKYPNLKFSPFISSQAIIQNADIMSGGIIFGVNSKKEAQNNYPLFDVQDRKKSEEVVDTLNQNFTLASRLSMFNVKLFHHAQIIQESIDEVIKKSNEQKNETALANTDMIEVAELIEKYRESTSKITSNTNDMVVFNRNMQSTLENISKKTDNSIIIAD